MNIEMEEAFKKSSLGTKVRLAVFTSLEPNDDSTGLRYHSRRAAAKQIHQGKLEGIPARERGPRLDRLAGSLTTTLDDFARNTLAPDSERNALRAQSRNKIVLDEVRSTFPVYSGCDDEQLIGILLREIPFPNPISGQEVLTTAEIAGEESEVIRNDNTLFPTKKEEFPAVDARERFKYTGMTTLENAESLFGKRRKKVLAAYLAVKRTDGQTNFLYPDDEAVTLAVYADQRKKGRSLEVLERAARLSREYYVYRLAECAKDPSKIDTEMEDLFNEICSIPEYRDLSWVRIVKVLRRHINFTDLHDPDPKFDKLEIADGTIVTNRVVLKGCPDGTEHPAPEIKITFGRTPPPELIGKNGYGEGNAIEIPLPELPEGRKLVLREKLGYYLMLGDPLVKDYLFPSLSELGAKISRDTPWEKRRPRDPNKYRGYIIQLALEFINAVETYDEEAAMGGERGLFQFQVDEFLHWVAQQKIYENSDRAEVVTIMRRERLFPEVVECYKTFKQRTRSADNVAQSLH